MNIINALPGIVPTARSHAMGQWPQKRIKMRNGRTVRWPLCSKPSDDGMELVWENITYAQAEQLCIVWDRDYGIYGSITLPPETLAGTSGGLNSLLALPFPGATWHFAGAPQVEAVKARRCTVRMPIKVRAAAIYTTFPDDELPAFEQYKYVKWVGRLWSEKAQGGVSTGAQPDYNVETDWEPLFDSNNQAITYGIGGIELASAPFNAQFYLGPWYSNINIKILAYPDPGYAVGGAATVFKLYKKTIAGTPTSKYTAFDNRITFARYAPDKTPFAAARGKWLFADASYRIKRMWDGFPNL